MSIAPALLAARYPRLYHMAYRGSWPSIKRHGLLSTRALLDLFGIRGAPRRKLESMHRPNSIKITHDVHGAAMIRDQKPMSDVGLKRCLTDGLSPADWYRILNRKVFFWLTIERLEKMMAARPYRDHQHLILILDTVGLVERHKAHVFLTAMNTGCTTPFPHPRGEHTFLCLNSYPYEDRVKRRLESVVELAVKYAVPDVLDFIVQTKLLSYSGIDTL